MYTQEKTGVVRIEQPGAPNVLTCQTVSLPELKEDEVLMNQKAIGVNFVDVFFRNGSFPMDSYPAPVGLEAAGVIEQVGTGVRDLAIGDRVAYYFSPGAYAQKRVFAANDLFKLPDDISFDQAAAIMIKGLTAHMLLNESHEIKAREVVLIHAMAGGVGTVLSTWAKALGATVIGTVGSAAKKELALKRGFEHVIDLQSEDLTARVNSITGGKGIDVVYDGTGEATFHKSLALVKEGGSAVLYGWPSGMPVTDPAMMAQKKIRFVSAVLNNYMQDKERIAAALTEIFDLVRSGVLDVPAPTVYSLADAAIAHADLETRKTIGSIILRP